MSDAPQLAGRTGSIRWAYLGVLLGAMLLYGVSAAPDVLWHDSGMTVLRAWRADLKGWLGLALSHPTYYLLVQPFVRLPVGEPAARVNLFSALCAALAVANLFVLLVWVTRRRAAALVGATALAVSHSFWWHAAVAEVYALSAAGITTEWLLLASYLRSRDRRCLLLLGAVSGFNAANHLLSAFCLVGYGVILFCQTWRRERPWRDWPLFSLSWLAGFSPMLILMVDELRAGLGPGELLRSLLFGAHGYYGRAVLNITPSLGELLRSGQCLLLNFPTPAAALIVLGLVRARGCWACPAAIRRLMTGLLVAWLIFAARYSVPDQYAFFYPFCLTAGFFIGLGAERLLRAAGRWRLPAALCAAALPAAVYVVLPGLARAGGLQLGVKRDIRHRDAYSYFLRPWKSGYHGARSFGIEALRQAGPGGTLIADATIIPVLLYLQQVDGIGVDVNVQTFWNHPFYGPATINERNAELVVRSGRFVALCADRPPYVPGWAYRRVEGKIVWRYRLKRVGPIFRLLPLSNASEVVG